MGFCVNTMWRAHVLPYTHTRTLAASIKQDRRWVRCARRESSKTYTGSLFLLSMIFLFSRLASSLFGFLLLSPVAFAVILASYMYDIISIILRMWTIYHTFVLIDRYFDADVKYKRVRLQSRGSNKSDVRCYKPAVGGERANIDMQLRF